MTREAAFDAYAVLQVVPSCDQEVIHAAYRTEIYSILGNMGRSAA